jgi:hypothetical protein
VAFTSGHGEPSPGELDPRKPGLGLWRSRLTSTGSETFELNLRHDEIAPETALVIVAAPKTPLQPEEVAKLRAYADRGGRLLVIAGNSEKTGLEEYLKSFNVEIGPGLIVDPRWNYNRRVQVVFAPCCCPSPRPCASATPPRRTRRLSPDCWRLPYSARAASRGSRPT